MNQKNLIRNLVQYGKILFAPCMVKFKNHVHVVQTLNESMIELEFGIPAITLGLKHIMQPEWMVIFVNLRLAMESDYFVINKKNFANQSNLIPVFAKNTSNLLT